RVGSPPGGSTLITSAPLSARTMPASAAGMPQPNSSTRSPASALAMIPSRRSPLPLGEGIKSSVHGEAVELLRVLVDDLTRFGPGYVREQAGNHLARMGPGPLVVRVVVAPHDRVCAGEAEEGEADRVFLESQGHLAL